MAQKVNDVVVVAMVFVKLIYNSNLADIDLIIIPQFSEFMIFKSLPAITDNYP